MTDGQRVSFWGRIADFLIRRPESTVALVAIVLGGYFALVNEAFLTTDNLRVVSQYMIAPAILALILDAVLASAVWLSAPGADRFGRKPDLPQPLLDDEVALESSNAATQPGTRRIR